ncbi:MAG: hypothetical protein AAF553_05245 [Pseudomonadota bacterium]
MAIGVIANSKSALAFAGGVLVSAALIAMSMGSQFTPKAQEDEYAEEEVESSEEEPKRRPTRFQEPAPVSFEDFAADTDLVDDTSGFDPTPPAESSVIISDDSDDDDYGFATTPFKPTSRQDIAASRARERQMERNKYTPNELTAAGAASRPDEDQR